MKIHFIGIGGIGVSSLARYYLAKGHKVSGSDLVSSEITDALSKLGARTFIGFHRPKNISTRPGLVVYSQAVPSNNPELKEAKKRSIKCLSYPQALGELTRKYFTIAVCGSHGKSTVAAMTGIILVKASFNPTVILGTKLKEFGDSNCRVGKSKYLVIEADEHFASFLNYWPKIIVLTNLEPDHLDYFKNFKNYILAFEKFISHLPKDGILVANKDDKNIKKMLITHFPTVVENVLWYSLKEKEGEKIKKILKIPGDFNVLNALAALTVARTLKIPNNVSFKALSEYRGSWRRFETIEADLRGFKRRLTRRITLINDYAHHPTQIKVTLKAAKDKFPKNKIWCIFQPHQYQRTYYLWKEFIKVFKQATVDKLIITDIYDVAGRETPKTKKKVSSQKLAAAICRCRTSTITIYLPKDEIIDYLKKNLRGREVIIIMGAGDIYDLSKELKKWQKT